MTESEAKEMLEAKLQCMILEDLSCVEKGCDRNCDDCNYNYMQGTVGEHKEALRMAVNALNKQIANKPTIKQWSPAICPSCGCHLSESFGDGYYRHCTFLSFCDKCGQKLDWSEV